MIQKQKSSDNSQALTPEQKYKNDLFAQKWVETSIEIGSLAVSDIATSVHKLIGMTEQSARKKFYYSGYNNQDFLDYWHNKYADYYKSRSKAKVHRQIDDRIDKTRNLSQLVETAKYLDGEPKQQSPQVQVNIMNALKSQMSPDIATSTDDL